MNPVIVSCGWDKVVKVRLLFSIDSYTLVFGRDVIVYICYFGGLQPNETIIYHQDL